VPAPRLTLVGKPDCHLCHEMAAVVRRVLGPTASLEEKDMREDPDLERRYVFEIPVLLWEGREVARHRVEEAELRARLVAIGAIAEGQR
jgi:hypothetical protein